jgi:hypothetical protein
LIVAIDTRLTLKFLIKHSDAELLEMIERADTDTDGEISPDEFYAIMTKKTFT